MDVFGFEEGILVEYGLGGIPCGQKLQHVLDGETHASDDRLAAENVAANGGAIKQLGFPSHSASLHVVLWVLGDLNRAYQADLRASVQPTGCFFQVGDPAPDGEFAAVLAAIDQLSRSTAYGLCFAAWEGISYADIAEVNRRN